MANEINNTICIVGAGIMGSYCALHLLGLAPATSIKIIDREPFGYENASCGNLGGFATSEVQPRTTFNNLIKVPFWLLNPLGPLALRPAYLPKLLPWLWGFMKATFTPGHYKHVVRNQQQLMVLAYRAHKEALVPIGLDKLIKREGTICLYKKTRTMERDWRTRLRLLREQGNECRRLQHDELKRLLPDLNSDIQHAIHIPGIYYWLDPAGLLKGLHEYLQKQGVQFITGEITGFSRDSHHVNGITVKGGEAIFCNYTVVTAGAWSKSLCNEAGDSVPLDTERGYHTTLKNPGVQVNHLLLLVDDDFVATPITGGLRLGGTVEFAGLHGPANFKRTDLLATRIKDYFPTIDTKERNEWLGFRPSIPDYLPVIGPSPTHGNIFYAFGHGHVGMTQGAITGKLTAQAITGSAPDIDLQPFSIARFNQKWSQNS